MQPFCTNAEFLNHKKKAKKSDDRTAFFSFQPSSFLLQYVLVKLLQRFEKFRNFVTLTTCGHILSGTFKGVKNFSLKFELHFDAKKKAGA